MSSSESTTEGKKSPRKLIGGLLGLSALIPKDQNTCLELQFTSAPELFVYLGILNWDREEFGHKTKSTIDLTLTLDGPGRDTYLTNVKVLNALYVVLPNLFPNLQHLTIKWEMRHDEDEAKDGHMVGNLEAVIKLLPSLRHIEIATSCNGVERSAFRALYPKGTSSRCRRGVYLLIFLCVRLCRCKSTDLGHVRHYGRRI